MILFQFLLAGLLISLELGPLGRYLNPQGGVSLTVAAAWAFAWFVDRRSGLRWAIISGVLLDLISFLPFGVWTGVLVIVVLLTDLLKTRFFEVSSLPLAMTALALATLSANVAVALFSRSFDWVLVLANTTLTTFAGLVCYYIVAVRWRFLQHWTGRRL